MESGFYGIETSKQKIMIDIKLINKYIERIKIDYPEDDKLMIDLQQFAQEVVKNCSIPAVVESSFDLVDWTLNKARIGVSGTIIFESPYYSVICKKLGIKYTDLSRLGKAMLRADCIDAYNLDRDELRDSEYYLGF